VIEAIIRETARECDDRLLGFLTEAVNPGAAQRDRDGSPLPAGLFREAVSLGLFRCALPEDLGWDGFDPLRWGLMVEHLGYRCTDLSFPLLAYLFAGTAWHLYEGGDSALIDSYARPAARGDIFIGFAYTEDRDPFAFRSRMTRHGDTIVVTCAKDIVAAALLADAFLTYVRDENGALVCVLLQRDDPGVIVEPLDVVGFRSAGFGRLSADEVSIPAGRVVDLDGLSHAQHVINTQVVFFCAGPVGRLRGVLDDCVKHVSTVERHRTVLSDFSNVQSLLGRMYANVEICRSVLHRALVNMAHGQADPLWDPLSWLAKYTAGELGVRIVTMAQRLTGTAGFLRANAYDRHLRDLSGLIAGGNPQEKIQIDLGAAIARVTPAAAGRAGRQSP
jgi:alkylation response protein AidB-like acyl-CoA dehydrogenase